MTPHPQPEKVWKLTARGDAGMTIERDTDLSYLRSQKRRYENMGMDCRIEESLCQSKPCATHTPAAPATETISKDLALELCMDARKAEREHVLDELILMIKRKEGCGYIFMDGPRFFTMIESLRGGD